MTCKNTPVHSLCLLPLQQKMAQKIMKMIQGDYTEKPDFALKSIGKCPPPQSALRNASEGGSQFWSGAAAAAGKFTLRANLCSQLVFFHGGPGGEGRPPPLLHPLTIPTSELSLLQVGKTNHITNQHSSNQGWERALEK